MYIFDSSILFFFFFNDPATTEIYTLSLHDALPISAGSGFVGGSESGARPRGASFSRRAGGAGDCRNAREAARQSDRKSTRLNSSHRCISYAVFCLKKKKTKKRQKQT